MRLALVNLSNIGLMLVSLALAMRLPFETFLVAYAVLGPAHYLTEISWLHDRQYFTPRRRDWLPLAALCVAIAVINLLTFNYPELRYLGPIAVSLMLFGFGLAAILVLWQDRTVRWAAVLVLAVVTLFLHDRRDVFILAGVYLPTLVHVALFTAAFVWFGALKSKSLTGHASLLVFLACGAIALFVDPGTLGYSASQYAQNAYRDFVPMHVQFAYDAGRETPPFGGAQRIFGSAGSLQAARFIAFAYTYHYFNWFSKTSVIRWHEVSKRRIAVIGAVWALSVGAYALDYGIGLRWLLFLSYLHVLLEFPLNHRSFVGIGHELWSRVRPTATARVPA